MRRCYQGITEKPDGIEPLLNTVWQSVTVNQKTLLLLLYKMLTRCKCNEKTTNKNITFIISLLMYFIWILCILFVCHFHFTLPYYSFLFLVLSAKEIFFILFILVNILWFLLLFIFEFTYFLYILMFLSNSILSPGLLCCWIQHFIH